MKLGTVLLAALTVVLLQQPAFSSRSGIQQEIQFSNLPAIIPDSMLKYGNEISHGKYGKVTSGTLLYNGVRVPVVIKKDRLTGKWAHGVQHEKDALR